MDSITVVTTKGLNEEGNIAYDSMVKLMQYTKEMIEEAKKAGRGVLNRSEFNDGLIRLGEELHYEIDRCKDILHHRELAMAKAAAPRLEESILVETEEHKEKKKEQGGQFDAKQTKIISLKEQLNDRDTKLNVQEKTLKKVNAENSFLRDQLDAQEKKIRELTSLMNQRSIQPTAVNTAQKETIRAGPSIFRR